MIQESLFEIPELYNGIEIKNNRVSIQKGKARNLGGEKCDLVCCDGKGICHIEIKRTENSNYDYALSFGGIDGGSWGRSGPCNKNELEDEINDRINDILKERTYD